MGVLPTGTGKFYPRFALIPIRTATRALARHLHNSELALLACERRFNSMKTGAPNMKSEIPHSALRMLRRWQLGVSSTGDLWIEPIGVDLRLVELGELVRLLRPHCQDGFPRRLMFRLSGCPIVGASAETVQRAIRQFARDMNIDCDVN